jgi:hypothetical protein
VDAEDLAMGLGKIARDAVVAARRRSSRRPRSRAYRPLLGFYVNPEQGLVLRLEWRDGALVLLDSADQAWRRTLAPTEVPDVFLVEPGVRESGEPATFRRNARGRVTSVHLASETHVRLDPVE